MRWLLQIKPICNIVCICAIQGARGGLAPPGYSLKSLQLFKKTHRIAPFQSFSDNIRVLELLAVAEHRYSNRFSSLFIAILRIFYLYHTLNYTNNYELQ